MLNKSILMGRLVRDPDLRHTQRGTAVASFTLAIDRDRKAENGERQTDFVDCIAWGKLGEFACNWFSKGQLAIVCGRVASRNWEDKNGNKRTSIEVVAEEMNFGETKKAREASGYTSPAPTPQPQKRQEYPAANMSLDDFSELPDGDDDDVLF